MNLEFETAPDKWRSEDVKTVENVDFSSLLLSEQIQEGLKNCGFEKPSPVQLQAIPLGRCGIDLIVQAKSGTGKTCVLAVIALDSLIVDSPNTQVLILAPTREIASQICGVIQELGCAFSHLTCETFIGGFPLKYDKAKLPCCQIVVGTPGRIKQLIDMEHIQTDSVRLFIVDEADRLFDKQFKEDINWIFSSLPSRKQFLALSATYPEELSKFLSLYMENPVFVRINSKDPALLGITQYFRSTAYHPMLQVSDSAKFDALLDILNSITFSQCMIFCQRQTKAQDLADNLVLKGFPSLAISGSLDQVRRLEIINELKTFRCRVLVSTDLTARGIDAENVNLVINFEIPYEAETYLHRIGRAGRYGTRGMSISLASSGDELKRLSGFQKKFLFKIYELPDPIPDNLWDTVLPVQLSLAEVEENGHVLSSVNDLGCTSDMKVCTTHESLVHRNEIQNQSLSLNHSDIIPDQSERNAHGDIHGSNNVVIDNGTRHENGCDPSNMLTESEEVILTEKEQFVNAENKPENVCESDISNLSNNNSPNQVEYQEWSVPQNSGQGNDGSVESQTASNGVVGENVSVNIVQESCGKDDVMCRPKEACAVIPGATPSEMVFGSNMTSSTNLPNSTDMGLTEQKVLDSGGIKYLNQLGGDLAQLDDFDSVTTDSLNNKDFEESECCSKSTTVLEKQALDSKVSLCSLFQNYLHSNEGTLDFPDKDISDILVPLLSINNTERSKPILSYDELAHSLEACGDISKTECSSSSLSYNELVHNLESYSQNLISPVKLNMETCVPGSRSIPQEQVEVLQKYIAHGKSKFFSSVHRIFEMETAHSSFEGNETGTEPLSGVPDSDELLNTIPSSGSLSIDVFISQSTVSCEEDSTEQTDSAMLPIDKSVAAAIECAKTENGKEPDIVLSSTVAVKPHAVADNPLSKQFLPFRTNKPLEEEKGDSSASKCSVKFDQRASHLTEDVYDSVTCGIKHSRIVTLPPVPGDSLLPVEYVNRSSGPDRTYADETPTEKNQGVKKKVRGKSQKARKHKQKHNECPAASSVQIPPQSEQIVPNQNILSEQVALPFPVWQEVKTKHETRKNISSRKNSVPDEVYEQRLRVDNKKKGKVTTAERRHKHRSSNNGEAEMNTGSARQNPLSFANVGMNDCFSSCVSFAPHYICCCQLPYISQNRNYSQYSVPFQNIYPEYYYNKFLQQWYYIQELTYGYNRH